MAELVSIIGMIRRLTRPGGGRPEHPIAPGGEVPVDPDYDIPIEAPSHPIEIPDPPPGIWPPPTPEHPIVPVPPGVGLPPGEIWPPPGPIEMPTPPIAMPPGKFVVLVYIPGYGYKYVVVDPSLKPTPVAK